MKKLSITRQITDLQAQAERLIRTNADITEIEAFCHYNDEIKNYLLNHINDEFVLNYIKTIPNLDINTIETKPSIFIVLIGLFMGGSSITHNERAKKERALIEVKEISNKYSSYEMMIRNYFDD